MIELPKNVHSAETYTFLGFSDETAGLLHAKFCNLEPDIEQLTGFFEFSQDWLDGRQQYNVGSEEDNWENALRSFGVNTNLRQAILKPGYEEIRLTQTALYWVKNAMAMRWMVLIDGLEASRERAEWIRGGGKQGTSRTFPRKTGHMFPTHGEPPGETVLWKATGRLLMRETLTDPTTQRLAIDNLRSPAPTDFNGAGYLTYFSPSLEGAQYYLRYVKDAWAPHDVCLAKLAVPNKLIEGADPMHLYFPSDLFKKTIWYSRTNRRPSLYIPELRNQHLLIGHTTTGINFNGVYGTMKDWRDISEKNLVRLKNGEFMTQYAFDDEFGLQINAACAKKLWAVHGENPEQEFDLWQ